MGSCSPTPRLDFRNRPGTDIPTIYHDMPLSPPHSYPLAWKIYSVLVILVDLATIVGGGLSISNVLGGVISFVLCLPLVGHAWQRALVPSWVGKAAFILGLFCIPVVLISSASRLGALGLLVGSVLLLIYAPFCRANFLYGYRSNHLWSGVAVQ